MFPHGLKVDPDFMERVGFDRTKGIPLQLDKNRRYSLPAVFQSGSCVVSVNAESEVVDRNYLHPLGGPSHLPVFYTMQCGQERKLWQPKP